MNAFGIVGRPAIVDSKIATVDPTQRLQGLLKCRTTDP